MVGTKKSIIQLREKVNIDTLSRLIGCDDLDTTQKDLLYSYRKLVQRDYAHIEYNYSKGGPQTGRLYAKNGLSLQSFKKEIRHTLAKDLYIDIDIANCGPRILEQYCIVNDIECKYLTRYNNYREKWLKKICTVHDVNRDEAKNLMIRLTYLGSYSFDDEIVEDKIPKVESFSKEMRAIASKVCKIEKSLTKSIEANESKDNVKASVLSLTVQVIENNCIQSMRRFFNKKGYVTGVLCFDGIMVEKKDKLGLEGEDDFNQQLLTECQDYVEEKIGYQIELNIKVMDHVLELPPVDEFVQDDKDVQEKLFILENPEYFKYCNKVLYVFNERTGTYDDCDNSNESVLHYYIAKHAKYFKYETSNSPNYSSLKSYGRNVNLINRIIVFVKLEAHDPDWLERTAESSRGYLLFKDGIYNMMTDTFTKGFDSNIVFHCRIPHKFPVKKANYINYANEISFQRLFNNSGAILAAFSKALAGMSNTVKEFYICPGNANAGKSKLINMMQEAFGSEYIGEFNAENLAYTDKMDSKDAGAKNRWIFLNRFKRILFSSEVSMNKTLDANYIKKIAGGGDKVIGRTLGKEEKSFKPHFLVFCMLNDVPKIEPMDDAMYNRLKYCEFPKVFSANPTNSNEIPIDVDIESKICSKKFIAGFIHLVLDAFQNYLKNGQPAFDEKTKEEWMDGNEKNNGVEILINQHFTITKKPEDQVTVADMNAFKHKHKSEVGTMSPKRFKEILETLGLEQKRIGPKQTRTWIGIKVKTDEDLVNFDD